MTNLILDKGHGPQLLSHIFPNTEHKVNNYILTFNSDLKGGMNVNKALGKNYIGKKKW